MSLSNNYTYYDLDLEKLETTQDPALVQAMVSQLMTSDSDYKILPARQWIENFLYYCGTRDIVSRLATGTVTNGSLSNNFGNSNSVARRRIPKLFKAVQAMASNVTRQKPSIKVWPSGEDERSDAKAKISNLLLDYAWDIDNEDDLNYEAMLWALMTPLGVRKDFISYEFNASRMWPVTDQAMNPMTGQPSQQPRVGENGQPMMQQMPWNSTEIHSAFNVFLTPTANNYNKIDFAGDISVRRIGWVKQQMNKNEEGYSPWKLNDLKPGSWNFTAMMALQASMKQLTFGTFRMLRSWNYNYVSMKDGCVCVDLYVQPSPAYPHGRRIFIANAIVLYDGPSPAYRESPKMIWHPYNFLCYERVPGRPWGTSYAEKLTDLQRAYEQARTEWDQLRRTMAQPKMILPIGAMIERDSTTGNTEILRFNPFGPGGGEPKYLTSPQPSTVIMDDVKAMQGEWTEISGITEIMMGIRPQGVSTYRGLEVLREEANNSQNNFIRMYESLIQGGQWNKLENIRYCLQYPNKNLTNAMRVFKKVKQYVTDVDIQDFVGSDLAGFVEIEAMSSIGKSKLALQEKYTSLAQMGVLGDIVNDPDLNQEFKRKMDVIGFESPSNQQVIMARYENQLMLQAEDMQQLIVPPIHDWDQPTLHIRECDKLLNDPSLQSKQFIIQSVVAHKQYHQQQQAEQMAQQMQQAMQMQQMQAGMAPPPGQPPPKGEGNHMNNPKGNGSGFATQSNLGGHGGKQEMLFGPESGGTQQMEGGQA